MLFEILSDVVYSHERAYETFEASTIKEAWKTFDAKKAEGRGLVPAYGQRKPRALFEVAESGVRKELSR